MVKHKPPSRIRYEKSHPVVSFRLEQSIKERLEEVLEGNSFASFIKEALGVREREKKSLDEKYKEGYKAGYLNGYDQAERKFCVTSRCAICGYRIVINHPEAKKQLDEMMRDHEWCHGDCLDRVERMRE